MLTFLVWFISFNLNAATAVTPVDPCLSLFELAPLTAEDPAFDFFSRRQRLMRQMAPAFIMSSEAVERVYQSHLELDQIGLPPGSTRFIYASLVGGLGEDYARIAGPLATDLADPESRLFRVFGWSLNRMKEAGDEPDRLLRMITRGSLDDLKLPYGMHTHLDVPLAISALGFAPSELTLAFAFSHDTFEEGSFNQQLVGEGNERRLQTQSLDLKALAHIFGPQFGNALALGIQMLTESEYEEIEAQVPHDQIQQYISEAERFVHRPDEMRSIPRKWDQKYHFEDPLVFGGLALQISKSVGLLPETLLRAIVEAEMGDRLSDISDMERFFVSHADSPMVARYRFLLYSSRMLNMLDKLSKVAATVNDIKWQADFERASRRYRQLLWLKIESLNVSLMRFEIMPISKFEMADFYHNRFREIQRRADDVMDPFLERKITGLVRQYGF